MGLGVTIYWEQKLWQKDKRKKLHVDVAATPKKAESNSNVALGTSFPLFSSAERWYTRHKGMLGYIMTVLILFGLAQGQVRGIGPGLDQSGTLHLVSTLTTHHQHPPTTTTHPHKLLGQFQGTYEDEIRCVGLV
jgi:hypothetical protein